MVSVATAAGEVMRVILPPAIKSQFQSKCNDHGQKMSERMRQLVVQDLAAQESPADKLSAILASAERKKEASGLPEPSIEDIDAFIDAVRAERISSGLIS